MPNSFIHVLDSLAYRTKNRLVNLFDPPVVVLLYHRVPSIAPDPQLLSVSPDNFRAHMQFLKNNYTLVRFEEDWSKLKKPAIVITFDDGYADNAREALPILEEVGVPATFFISTGLIGTPQQFWWDELAHIILGDHDFPERFELADNNSEQVWPSATSTQRLTFYGEIQLLMKNINAHRRESWLRQLRRWVHTGEEADDSHRLMSIEELRSLADSRWVTIGAHTVSHTALSSLTFPEQRHEIIDSKTQLESWLGKEINVFSYPFGSEEDYTQDSATICKEAGFIKAAANFPAQVHNWTDLYKIPRQLVRNWSIDIFPEKLKRFWIA